MTYPAGPVDPDLVVGVGLADDADVLLDLGPGHPSAHGALRLAVRRDGDRIVALEARIGAVHRGAEKLLEARDYRQGLLLADRHDWLSGFTSELAVALAVEQVAGIRPPARADWLRTLLAELSRLGTVFAHLAAVPWLLPAAAGTCGTAREAVLDLVDAYAGVRLHPMAVRVGGLAYDAPEGWTSAVRAALPGVRAALGAAADGLDGSAARARLGGLAVLDAAAVVAYGASGPVARAAGVDLDVRRTAPYAAYGDLATLLPRQPAGGAGDAAGRYTALVAAAQASADLVAAAADGLDAQPPGPVAVRLPKVLRPPAGSAYAAVDTATGITGAYLVSHADRAPHRLKLRTPSFAHVQALATAVVGCTVEDLVPALASFFFLIGDIDR